MPEPTLEDLTVRVAELEQQIESLESLFPRRAPWRDAPEELPAAVADRVAALERRVAWLLTAGRPPKPFPAKPTSTYENLVGTGADLWDTDEELDDFLARIRESRQQSKG